MIPDKPISFYHAGFVKFFNQGLKSSFPDSPLSFFKSVPKLSPSHGFFALNQLFGNKKREPKTALSCDSYWS